MLVSDFLRQSAQRHPEKLACIFQEQRTTYGQLESTSNQLAHALIDAGIHPGDRVAVYAGNRTETVTAIFGILKAGAAIVIIPATTKPDKLCYMLNDCSASAAIVAGPAKAAIEAIEQEVESLQVIMTCAGTQEHDPTIRTLRFDEDLAAYPSTPPPAQIIDVDIAAIIYTSGSTGHPKGVVVTHGNIVSTATSIIQYLESAQEDIILNVLPLSSTYGLYQPIMTAMVGATLVLETSFAYPFKIIKLFKEERITGFAGVPTMYAVILGMEDLDPADFDSVKYITNASAALPAAHVPRLKALFRNARIYLMHGLTECARTTFLPPDEVEQKPSSVGRGMPNVQLDVFDPEGNPVKPGETGELVVRGANVMQGYWGRPEETARVLKPGRHPWEKVLHSGDLFRIDEDGYLYFVSRMDDIIKSRGEKISPIEVEHVIAELAEVQEVAVVGVSDPILGEAVKAVIVLADGKTLTERNVIAYCNRRLESAMAPKYVEFRDALPKTDSGNKVKKSLLRESAQATETNQGTNE